MGTWSAVFLGLWLLSMAWIAVDNDVLGVPYFFRHLGEAKSHGWPARFYWKFGWRLVVLVTIQVGMLASLIQFKRAAWDAGWPGIVIFGVAACAVAALTIQRPRWHPYFEWQRRRQARTICRRLGSVVLQLEQSRLMDELTEAATYATQRGWLARHPRGDDRWPDVVPIAYVLPDANSSIVFPIDFESFVAWRLPSEFARSGQQLPFEGPSGTTFKLRKALMVRGCPHWTLLRTETDFGDPLASDH